MFCPSDLPVGKAKGQNLQVSMSKAFGDMHMEEYLVFVRPGHMVPHAEDEHGNVVETRPDMAQACYKITIHRKEDNKHAEELWTPEFVDSCLASARELDKAVRRFTDAFDTIAAEESTIH